MPSTRLISVTPKAEEIIMYCARVSNPENQSSDNPKLLDYCIKNGHWSIFEMADMTVEIETSRAIAAQLLRHKSFFFQEFSQRYSKVEDNSFELYSPRRQDIKNRQNSLDDLSEDTKIWFKNTQETLWETSKNLYNQALKQGISKESARFLLPLSTKTKLYMKSNLRNWLHYIELRTEASTQKEHRDIANAIKIIFIEQFPNISKAKGWV